MAVGSGVVLSLEIVSARTEADTCTAIKSSVVDGPLVEAGSNLDLDQLYGTWGSVRDRLTYGRK
jgi:hypothetical protein